MTWKDFQNDAYALTEREINVLRKECLINYELAKKAVKRELDDLYLKYLTGIKPEDYYNTVIKFDRLVNIQKTINLEYTRYTKQAGGYIEAASHLAMSNIYYRKMYAAGWLIPEVTPGILPPALIEFSVYGTAEKWKEITKSIKKTYGRQQLYQPQGATLSSLLVNNRRKEIIGIERAITQGLQLGYSNNKMVDAVADIIGKRYVKDGVISYSGAQANALRIIQTETTRTMNAGGYAQSKYLSTKGVQMLRIWDSALDSRTRSSHAALDGQKKTIDEPFFIGSDRSFYPGGFAHVKNNVRCRCTVADTVNGNDPQLRRGRNPVTGKNEVFNYKRFDQWATDQGLIKNKYGEYYKKS